MNPFFKKKAYINLPLLLRIVGWLLITESVMMVIPTICAFIYHESSAFPFMGCMAITAVSGFGLTTLKLKNKDMGKREAVFLTGIAWVILSLFGMLPFLLCGTHLNITDAFFETMSGFTTTGASVLGTLKNVPHSVLLWRCLVEWLGGLGIMLFTLAVVPMLNYQGGMQLFYAEVTGVTHDKLRPRISYTAQSLWGIYMALTLLLMILLGISDMNTFDAICYGLAIMSTGGFDNNDLSIGLWATPYIKTVTTIFMFLGGVNFAIIYKTISGQFKSVWHNEILRVYMGIIVVSYLILLLDGLHNDAGATFESLTIDKLFQVVSMISSTGLSLNVNAEWSALATVVFIILMLMGACAGSTSGGFKIDRIIVLWKFLKIEFYRIMHPHSVRAVRIDGKGIQQNLVLKALAFLFLYFLIIIAGGCFLLLLGFDLQQAFYCTISAISNNTGVGTNYALIPSLGKWALSLIMLIGRLEIFTILLLFIPSFWRK